MYAGLVVLCSLGAYWAIFSNFQPYDDEGFFDYTLKLFISGHPLYNVVWTSYGPFYYELFGAFFSVVGHGPTTDSGRIVQLVIWIVTSLGLGVTAHRITGRLSVGAASLAVAFSLLGSLQNEPMHAEALICLLLTLILMILVFGLPRWPRAALAGMGALVAILVLTKINVGGYAAISIAFAVVMTAPRLVRSSALRWLAALIFVASGPVIMAANLNQASTRDYALLVLLSTLSIAFVAYPVVSGADRSGGRAQPSEAGWDWVLWCIAGFVAAAVVVLVILFALGTTPGAFWHLVVVVPTHQASLLSVPATIGGNAISWSLAATALAWALRRSGLIGSAAIGPRTRLVSGLVRLFAGVAILLSLCNAFPFQIGPDAPFALAMPLAFVAALPRSGDSPDPVNRLLRLLIPSLGVLQALLAYPVAGSQLTLGSILLVPCGALCLADGASELGVWNLAKASLAPLTGGAVTGLFVALAVGTGFLLVVQPLQGAHDNYRSGPPLPIAGASRLHLSLPEVVMYDRITDVLRSRCSSVMSLPALYSFNLWSGLPTPSPIGGAQPYWKELSGRQQSETLAAAKASPRLCVVRDLAEAGFYDAGSAPPPPSPLVSFLENDFKTVLVSGPYTVGVRP